MLEMAWKTEDKHEEILDTVQRSQAHIQAVDATLKKHNERMNKMDERMDLFEVLAKKMQSVLSVTPPL